MNLLERARQLKNGTKILTDWLGDGAVVVSQSDAQARADVCLKCPMNESGFKIAGAVASEIKRQVEVKNRLMLRVDGEKSLHTCKACGCALRLKIWLPDQKIISGENEQSLFKYHEDCWVPKLIPNPNWVNASKQ